MFGGTDYRLSVSCYLSRGTITPGWQQAWEWAWQGFKAFERQRREAREEMEACFERLKLFLLTVA